MGCSSSIELGCQLFRRLTPHKATFEGRFTDTAGLRIAVVVARFNDLVTAKLLSGCVDCLARHGIDTSSTSAQLDVAWVPGSFELPLVCQQLARLKQLLEVLC